MNLVIQSYRILNILSIDVALGSVICCRFFAHVLHIHLRTSGLMALGLTVWIIYTIDHLLDAYRLPVPASTKRHQFHQKYRSLVMAMLIVAIGGDLLAIFYIRPIVLISGVALMLLAALYLAIQRHLKFVKEICGAFLYSAGVLLVPVALSSGIPSLAAFMIMAQFVTTAFANLLLFSLLDLCHDGSDGQHSFTTAVGERKTRIVLASLFIISGGMVISQFIMDTGMNKPSAIIALMNLVLLIIYLNRDYFGVNDRYRLYGDAVFFLPLLLF